MKIPFMLLAPTRLTQHQKLLEQEAFISIRLTTVLWCNSLSLDVPSFHLGGVLLLCSIEETILLQIQVVSKLKSLRLASISGSLVCRGSLVQLQLTANWVEVHCSLQPGTWSADAQLLLPFHIQSYLELVQVLAWHLEGTITLHPSKTVLQFWLQWSSSKHSVATSGQHSLPALLMQHFHQPILQQHR